MAICSVNNCVDTVHAKRLCRWHYMLSWRGEDLNKKRRAPQEKHGYTRTSTYAIWKEMRRRCKNLNCTSYKDYGGRGISVCPRWDTSFLAFLEDMGERPDGLSLERIDNDGNYCPENCKWGTRHEQACNQRPKKNKTGHPGVVATPYNKFTASIQSHKKKKYLGTFNTLEEASDAYLKAKAERDKII